MGKKFVNGYMFDAENFARMLNAARGASTCKDFAAKCGISRSYFSKYLNRRIAHPPTLQTIRKIADHAENDVSFEDLSAAAGYVGNTDHAASASSCGDLALTIGAIILKFMDLDLFLGNLREPDYGFDISAAVRNISSMHEIRWFFYICQSGSKDQFLDSLYDCYGRAAMMECAPGPNTKVSLVVSNRKFVEEAGIHAPHGLPFQVSVLLVQNGEVVKEKFLETALDLG